MLSRAYKVCTNFSNLHDELIFLAEFYKFNGYPEHLNCHIKKFPSAKSDASNAKQEHFFSSLLSLAVNLSNLGTNYYIIIYYITLYYITLHYII